MLKSITNEFLQRTPVKDWSIISLLKYIDSKYELSADMIETVKAEIYSVLRSVSNDININLHGNAKKRAKKLLSNFGKLFSSADVNHFINELKLKEEKREYLLALNRKIISINSLQILEEHHMTRRLIDDLRDTSTALKRKSSFSLDDRVKKVKVVDNPSNKNISDKFEIVTESGNLNEEHNEKSVVSTPSPLPRRDDNPFLLSNENIPDKFEIITKSGNLDKEHNKESIVSTLPPLPQRDDVHTPNKRLMSDERVIRYLNAMEQLLEYNRVHIQTPPPMWTKIESYLENALKKSGEAFKEAIMQKIEEDNDNKLRLYCEKILMDFYNLVDVFPTLSRKIGESKYIVQNLSSLFKFYETTFGNITIDWIESHSSSAKLTKSPTSSGIVKLDAKGVRLFDDKEIWHMKVFRSPSSPTTDHAVGDTKKALHSDILNLVALLLDHLDVPLKTAINIKVFSLQAIGYRITLYSLSMRIDGSFLASELASATIPFSFEARSKYKAVLYLMVLFHDEFVKQLSILQELDFTVNYDEGNTVRDVLKIPKFLQDLLKWR